LLRASSTPGPSIALQSAPAKLLGNVEAPDEESAIKQAIDGIPEQQ
jgi:hypothetical protein